MARRTGFIDSTFTHAFGATRGHADDWFDPTLHTDTDLFIDPFLMFEETTGRWSVVHDRFIEFFNTALEHIAAAARNHNSVQWQRAAAMFSFPEPPEFCLGYGDKTIFGSGSAGGLGQGMLSAAEKAIGLGITNISDFGELLLFGEHFGADRVSDMVCNIVKDVFVGYTQDIATRHNLPTNDVMLGHQGFDFQHDRWARRRVELPINPCWQPATPVLLTPRRFLAELPAMDDGAFWEWVYSNQNKQLREDLGYHISQKVKKHEIINLAKQRLYLRRKYGVLYAQASRQNPLRPYDLDHDPKFKVTGFAAGEEAANLARLSGPASPSDFCQFVKALATEFKWAVEDRGIWKSFWSGNAPFAEPHIQRLFHVTVLLTCKRNNIDITPEADAGQGPVDFKFSVGWANRSLVELKFAKSSSFWKNLEKQTPAYLAAEQIPCGYIVIVQHEDKHCTPEFVGRVATTLARVSSDAGWTYEPVFVDARPKASASALKRTNA